MREMAISKTPWINQYPSDWEQVPLHALFCEHKNKNQDGLEQNLLSLSYGKVIRKDINSNTGLLPESFNGYNIVDNGDIVLRLTDLQNDHRSLRTGLVTERGIITSAYCTLRKAEPVSSKYYHYLLHAFDIMKAFYTMGEGIRQSLGYDELAYIIIPKPPLPEQHAIISYLDSKCVAIDKAIDRHKKIIEKLEEYRKCQITYMTTHGITHEIMKETSSEWYKMIPESWEIKRFKYIAAVKSNLVEPEPYMSYHQVGPDLIEKESGHLIGERTVEETGVISGNHLFFEGQILYSKVRPALNKVITAPYDGLCSADMYPIETAIDSEYMKYLMLSKPFAEQAGIIAMIRVKMPKINQDELADIVCAVPLSHQQKEIAAAISEMCSHVQESIDKHNDIIDKLEEYRKSIIYNAVTGKIDCRESA